MPRACSPLVRRRAAGPFLDPAAIDPSPAHSRVTPKYNTYTRTHTNQTLHIYTQRCCPGSSSVRCTPSSRGLANTASIYPIYLPDIILLHYDRVCGFTVNSVCLKHKSIVRARNWETLTKETIYYNWRAAVVRYRRVCVVQLAQHG